MYIFEVCAILLLADVFEEIAVVNFVIKATLTILISLWLKKNIFSQKKYFYASFFLICLVNPLFASFLLFIILRLEVISLLIIAKILADVICSILTYLFLRALPD